MADQQTAQPVFQIQRIYLKDSSLEQPNSPQILLEQAQPQVDVNLQLQAEPFADGLYEVAVTATVNAKVGDKTLFLIEVVQGGIFRISGVLPDMLPQVLGITCPNLLYPYAREVVSLGAGEILLTSMDRDGTKSGFDVALTRAVADAVPVPLIASGGVGDLDHLVAGVTEGHATAVLAASIFHFGEYTIRQAKEHMARAGIPMRLD